MSVAGHSSIARPAGRLAVAALAISAVMAGVTFGVAGVSPVLIAVFVSLAVLTALLAPSYFFAAALVLYSLFQSQWIELTFEFGDHQVNIGQVYLMLVAALLMVSALTHDLRRRAWTKPPAFVVLGTILAGWLGFSLLYAADPGDGVPLALRNGVGILVCYEAYVFGSDRRHSHIIQTGIGAACAWVAMTAFYDYLHPQAPSALQAISAGTYRAAGALGGVAVTATVLLTGTVFFVIASVTSRRLWIKLLCAGWAGFSALVLLFNFTRSTLVGLALTGVLFAIFRRGQGARIKSAGLVVCVLGAWLVMGLTILPRSAIEDRTKDLPSVTSDGPRTVGSGRNVIWSAVVEEWEESSLFGKLFGHGVGSVPAVVLRRTGVGFFAHNSYLAVLFDGGVIGLALYIAFAWSLLRRLWRRARETRPSPAGPVAFAYVLACFLSIDMFGDHLYSMGGRLYTMVFIGLVLAQGWPFVGDEGRANEADASDSPSL